jgi:diacylglycerol O-acyltransferase / wax synthase
MSRMRAMDAAFLAMERPAEPRHLGSLTIFGPGPDGPLTYDVVRAQLEARLALIASARRVVVETPLGLARPSWGRARGFDLEFHLRLHAVAAPGGPGELADLVAHAHAIPLDRSRPLWELWVIDGLADGRVALYAKMHMAAIDDVTGAEVMTALLDTDPTGVRPEAPEPEARPEPPLVRLFGTPADQLRQAVGFPARLANRTLANVGSQLEVMSETIIETIHRTPGLDGIARLLPTPVDGEVVEERSTGRAPRVSWNGRVTGHRRFAMARLPLADIIAIKRAAGTTVNDVVVAVCSGALRHWLDDHHELPTSPLVAMVPMLVGATDGRHDAHVAGLVVPLPTHVADPHERLQRTNRALAEAKRRRVAVPASTMQDVSMFAPPALSALAGRLVGALPHRSLASPTVNLAITNVPGSRQQMYLAGRPLEVSYPVLTINELSPLHIGLQSGPGVIGVGGLVCRDSMTDLDALIERMPVELEILGRATGARASRSTRNRRAI